jgi:hypothetical protein
MLAAAFADHPRVCHIKIADGSGRPLGRSFGVKLWPTLVFLRQGKEMARLVRPTDVNAIWRALAQIDPRDQARRTLGRQLASRRMGRPKPCAGLLLRSAQQ